jgi:SET domain-containing protein
MTTSDKHPKIIIPSNFFNPADPTNDTELRQGLKVAKSIIEGLGLFADRSFEQFQIIWQETLKGIGKNPESGGPLRWANHSDDPNSILVLGGELGGDNRFRTSLVAIKPIQLDEEITYNYSVFGHTGHHAFCNCQQPNCQGFFLLREEWGEKK